MPDADPVLEEFCRTVQALPDAAARQLAIGMAKVCHGNFQVVFRREAQIPPKLQLERAERWMNPVLQRRILGLLRGTQPVMTAGLMSEYFQGLSPTYERLLRAALEAEQTEEARRQAIRELGDDPFAGLLLLLARERNRIVRESAGQTSELVPGPPSASSVRADQILAKFDARMAALRVLADGFANLQPSSEEDCQEAFRSACLEQAVALFELRQRAAEARTTLEPITSRTAFVAELERIDELLEADERRSAGAAVFWSGLGAVLAGLRIEHRLDERQQELQALARIAADELASAPPLSPEMRLEIGGPDPAAAWLHWAWLRTGEDLAKLGRELASFSPALGRLLGEIEWGALNWPAPAPVIAEPSSPVAA